jgi:hypothetical protein
VPLSGGMELLNYFGLSTALHDGEAIAIQHKNRLRSAFIHPDQCEYEIYTESRKVICSQRLM